MKPYRVLLLVRNPIGGIRTFLRYHYGLLDPVKYRLVLIAPQLPETDLLRQDLGKFELDHLSVPNDIGVVELLAVASRTVRTRRFDLIHSHGFTSALCATPGARLLGRPHLVTLHETLFEERFQGPFGFLKRYALAVVLGLCDCIQCVSDDARENLLFHLRPNRAFEDRLVVIKTGVDVGPFLVAKPRDLRAELELPQEGFLIGFLGRFMPEKGFDTLIAAVHALRSRQLPKKLYLLCFSQEDGFIREERDRVKQLGLDEQVRFLPFVPAVAETLKGLDVVVMPSRREAAGLLAMETMVSGVPLIATACVGLREVAKESAATLVPVGDVVTLAEAIADEVTRPSTLRARGFVPEAVRRYDVRESVKALEQVMLALIAA